MDWFTAVCLGTAIIAVLTAVIQYGTIRTLQDEATNRRKETLRLREERDKATQEVTRLALAATRTRSRADTPRFRNYVREAEEGRRNR